MSQVIKKTNLFCKLNNMKYLVVLFIYLKINDLMNEHRRNCVAFRLVGLQVLWDYRWEDAVEDGRIFLTIIIQKSLLYLHRRTILL